MVKIRLKPCRFLNCLPFAWDEKLGRFVKISEPRHLKNFKLQCIFSVVHCIAMFLTISLRQLTLTGKFLGIGFFLMYICLTRSRMNYSLDNLPIQILNMILHFESKILQGEVKFINIKIFKKAFILTSCSHSGRKNLPQVP